MVRKLLVGVFVLLLLILAVALIAPGFIDWGRYRQPILAQATAALGRPVGIDGELHFSVLPSPTLSVKQAWIANIAGSKQPELARVGALDIRVALLPLLTGRVEVSSITLVEPRIALEVLADGTQSWVFPALSQAGNQADSTALRINDIRISNGTAFFSDARSGQMAQLTALNAQLRLDSLVGPFEMKADARLAGPLPVETAVQLDATIGRRAAGGAFPMRITLSLPENGALAAYQGIFNPTTNTVLQGEGRLEAEDLAKTLAALSGQPTALGKPLPIKLRGQLLSDGQSLDVNNLDFSLNGTRGSGAVQFSMQDALPHADIVLALANLDVDGWMAALGAGNQASSPATPMTLPRNLTAKLDISAEAVTYRGGLVRQGKLVAALEGGALLAERLSAQVPGGGAVAVTGSFHIDASGVPHLDADFEASAEDARATMAWLGLEAPAGIPSDRLRKVSLAAGLSGTPVKFRVPAFEANVDGSRLDGAFSYDASGGRTKIAARLEIDRFNLDAYLPPAGGSAAPVFPDAPAVDVSLDLTVGQLTVRGMTLGGVALAGALLDGGVSVRQARVADALGTTAVLSGSVTKLQPLTGLDLSVEINSADIGPLAQALTGQPLNLAPALRALKGTARVQGDAAQALLQTQFAAGPLALEIGGSVSDLMTTPTFDLRTRVRHPELKGLLAVVAPEWQPRAASLGSVDFYAGVVGTPQSIKVSGLQGKIGDLTVQGEGQWVQVQPRPQLTLTLRTSDLALEPWMPAPNRAAAVPVPMAQGGRWSAEPLQLGGLRVLDGVFDVSLRGLTWGAYDVGNVKAKAKLTDGTLILDSLTGDVFQGKLTAAGKVAAAAEGAGGTISGHMSLVEGRVAQVLSTSGGAEFVDGTVSYEVDLQAGGASQRQMISGLTGNGTLVVRNGALQGFDVLKLVEAVDSAVRGHDPVALISAAASGGRTPFRTLDTKFTIEKGVVRTETAKLDSSLVTGDFGGTLDLAGWSIDVGGPLTLVGRPDLSPLAVRYAGPLDSARASVDTNSLVALAVKKAANKLLDKVLPNRPSATDQPAQPTGQAPTPEDLIRGILNRLNAQ